MKYLSKIQRSTIILFFIVGNIFFTLYVAAEDKDSITQIAIFRTQLPYAQEIEQGLKNGLQQLGYSQQIYYLPLYIVGNKAEDFSNTAIQAQKILKKQPDIVATIGTQASIPVSLILEQTKVPMVFAGVSYPIESNLIEAFGKPTDKNRTGIGYSISAKQRLEIIRDIFPDKKRFKTIGFLYSSQILQEIIYIEKLKHLENFKGWEFVYIDFFDYAKNEISLKKLINTLKKKRPDLIFGWYSFNQLSIIKCNSEILVKEYQKPIIGITKEFVKEFGTCGILSDHQGIGFQQAKMIGKIIKGENAGSIPAIEPTKYLIELNIKKAKELNITFTDNIIKRAYKVFR